MEEWFSGKWVGYLGERCWVLGYCFGGMGVYFFWGRVVWLDEGKGYFVVGGGKCFI